MNLAEAQQSLDKIIAKSRVHFYKPIQVAEVLYRDRVYKDITLSELETYRSKSKSWRDEISERFIGRSSTSSARYQDDVFNENAVSPDALVALGKQNRGKKGIVEEYIYKRFFERFSQMNEGIDYCTSHNKKSFKLQEFIALFRKSAGLKRSVDKIFEIVVYSLFSAIVQELEVNIEVSLNPDKMDVLKEFEDFAERVINLTSKDSRMTLPASINRVGVTNAADRGLDMWANYGFAIQIKHLSLSEEIAEDITRSITADRIVIVCKDSEAALIASLLTQIGWRAKIQSIITEADLIDWYDRALRGKFANRLGDKVLKYLVEEIKVEFPVTKITEFEKFFKERNYTQLKKV